MMQEYLGAIATHVLITHIVCVLLESSIHREGDEFVGPFVAKLKGEVPEARVTLEVGEEGAEQQMRDGPFSLKVVASTLYLFQRASSNSSSTRS